MMDDRNGEKVIKDRVLVLCTGNSCRSQMAGTEPSGAVHPLAVAVMGELDIDIAGHESNNKSNITPRAARGRLLPDLDVRRRAGGTTFVS